MKLIRSALAVVRDFRRPYIALNAAYYGLVVVGMVCISFNPALQQQLVQAVGQSFSEGPLSAVSSAYGGGQVLQATALTFVVNLLAGTVLVIGLPSLFVPFSGLFMGFVRALLWGLILSPAHPQLRGPMIPHALTLILEGQGYIVAMLAAYVQARAFLWPGRVGVKGHGRGYLEGLKRTGLLYVLVAALLAVAAIYEALEVIYLVPLFAR